METGFEVGQLSIADRKFEIQNTDVTSKGKSCCFEEVINSLENKYSAKYCFFVEVLNKGILQI